LRFGWPYWAIRKTKTTTGYREGPVGLSNFWRRANNFDTARQARTAKPPKLRLAVTVPGLHDGPLQTTTSACTLSPHSAIIVDAASPARHTLHPRPTPHATDPRHRHPPPPEAPPCPPQRARAGRSTRRTSPTTRSRRRRSRPSPTSESARVWKSAPAKHVTETSKC
jgi:hypothetical protein